MFYPFVLAFAALTVAPSQALDRPRVLADYEITTWDERNGLFASRIFAMAQDSLGYLWLGTERGLIRFDGLRFLDFDADGPQLPGRAVAALYAARNGSLWVGFTAGGVSRIRHGRVRNYGERDGFTDGRVNAIVEGPDGIVWAGTRHGIYRLVDDRWEEIGPQHGLTEDAAATVYMNRAGTLWAATSGGVFRWEPEQDKFRFIDKPLSRLPSFSESPDGNMWSTDPLVGFRVLARREQAESSTRSVRQGVGHTLLHDRLGNLWVGTLGRGLWFVRNHGTRHASVEVIARHNGLSNDLVRSLLEDREGNVWVGTFAGLQKFSPRRLTPLTDLGFVRALEGGPDGRVWVGTNNGLIGFSENQRKSYGKREGLPSPDIRALHVDAAGVLWVATASGAARFLNGRFVPLPVLGEEWPDRITAIATDLLGNLWIFDLDDGLLRWNRGSLVPFDPSQEIRHTSIDFMAADRKGRLWLVVAGGGLGVIDGGSRFQLLRPSDEFHVSDMTIYEDRTGAIWFGGDRLTRFKDGNLATVTRQSGLPVQPITAITEDDEGYLWLGAGSGLARLTQGEFDKAAADPAHQIRLTLYDSSDGMAGPAARPGHRSAMRARDGRLWFVTANGVTIVDSRRISGSRPAPPVRIENIQADARSFDPALPLSLPKGTTNVQIDYTALTFFSPTTVQFRYRLEGFDPGWIDAGTRREAFYTNLPPGSFQFRVTARNSGGVWNEQAAVLDFSISPSFYQTRWFLSMCLVLLGLTVYAGWQLRLRAVRRQFSLVVAERVRLSREIHDTLLQSLVGVALQLNAASCSPECPSTTAGRLRRMRRQVEEYIREARQSIWELRSPTLETSSLAAALEEAGKAAIDGSTLDFEFEVSGIPDPYLQKPEIEQQVLRIAQEAIANAVRHARPRRIHVELYYEAHGLRLKISDDGCGFDPSELSQHARRHYGLLGMQERAKEAGGRFRLITRPRAGTEVELVVPGPGSPDAV